MGMGDRLLRWFQQTFGLTALTQQVLGWLAVSVIIPVTISAFVDLTSYQVIGLAVGTLLLGLAGLGYWADRRRTRPHRASSGQTFRRVGIEQSGRARTTLSGRSKITGLDTAVENKDEAKLNLEDDAEIK